jgi:hypothetical protein
MNPNDGSTARRIVDLESCKEALWRRVGIACKNCCSPSQLRVSATDVTGATFCLGEWGGCFLSPSRVLR